MKRLTNESASIGRRPFLHSLSVLGGAAMLSPGGLFGTETAGAQQSDAPFSAPVVQTDRKTEGGRGSSMRVRDEIMEYLDKETGARVRRLTGDGSDNVHLYFTSESFLAGPANRLVFASNRSGRFQFHLLDIEAAKLVQVTDGKDTPEHKSSVSTAQNGRRQVNFLAAHTPPHFLPNPENSRGPIFNAC